MNRRTVVFIILFAALLLAGVYYFLLREELSGPGLTLYGNVETREVDLAFNVGGPVARMLVEEGDAVDAGQLLAILERQRYEQRVAAAEAELAAQQAVVEQLERGSRPEEIAEAKAATQAARVGLANAERTLQRQQELVERNLASQQDLDAAREARDLAAAELEAARQRQALVAQGPRQEEIAAARSQLEALRAQLELARQDLADTELRASDTGTVLVRMVEPGAIVAAGRPIYTVALRAPVWVRSYVAEPNLGRIRPGQPVRVFTDSRPDQPYQGQIGFIAPTAEFTPRSVQTPELRTGLVYRFRVIVENPAQGLRQGMPVTLEIVPDRASPGET